MFWPSDEALRSQTWWTSLAWAGGPTFGQLVGALRPAIRAAWLLGWQVESIDVGLGVIHPNQTGMWQSIERATLLYEAETPMDGERPTNLPTVRLGVMEVAGLTGGLDGTFAMPVVFPDFVTEEYDPDAGTSDPYGGVPADMVEQIDAFVDIAVALLALTPDYFDGPVAGQGLLWTLSPGQWRGLSPLAVLMLDVATSDRYENTTDFLAGQIRGDGANLRVLLASAQERWRDNEAETDGFSALETNETEIWHEIHASLQERGEAHRLRERPRSRLRGKGAPIWLDVLTELMATGVVLVDQVLEPAEPVVPVEGRVLGGRVDLTIWGGDGHAKVWRVMIFDSEGNDGIVGSVAWDYLPGDRQNRPTVVIVAGRGVGISHDHAKVDDRPWDIQIIRVQDDSLIPTPGEQFNLMKLLNPYPVERTNDDYVDGATARHPLVMVRPKPDGVYLMYPSGSAVRDGPNGPILGPDAPCVIELTVDPLSGRAAYTVDVHYFEWEIAPGRWHGVAHLCVWASADVRIHTTDSGGGGAPVTGNPSAVGHMPFSTMAWIYSAEFWTAQPVQLLPRPFRTYLTADPDAARRPDLLDPGPPDGVTLPPAGITRTPATHSYKEYERELDVMFTLATALFDVLWSFIPFVGDATDVGEAVWVWQTGHDRWGRSMTDFERALTYVCASIPLLSGSFLRAAADLLGALGDVADTGIARLGRLFTPAGTDEIAADAEIASALAAPGTTRPYRGIVSPTDQARAEQLIRAQALDDSAIVALADRFIARERAGWLTVGDLLSDAGDGFSVPALQTAYARHQRRHGLVTVQQFVETAGG